MLSTDEGYQPRLEAFDGNFTAKIAASNLLTVNGLFVLKPFAWSIRAHQTQDADIDSDFNLIHWMEFKRRW
jgi:hypothetical protein